MKLRRMKFSVEQILEELKDEEGKPLSRRTYYLDLKAIHKDAIEWQFQLYSKGSRQPTSLHRVFGGETASVGRHSCQSKRLSTRQD
jgi:hypothetical protein